MLTKSQKENLFKTKEDNSVCICYICFEKLKMKRGGGRVWGFKFGTLSKGYDRCVCCDVCSGIRVSTYI